MTEPLDYRKVPRYSIVGGIYWPACSGDWVKYSHYLVLLAAYESLKAQSDINADARRTVASLKRSDGKFR